MVDRGVGMEGYTDKVYRAAAKPLIALICISPFSAPLQAKLFCSVHPPDPLTTQHQKQQENATPRSQLSTHVLFSPSLNHHELPLPEASTSDRQVGLYANQNGLVAWASDMPNRPNVYSVLPLASCNRVQW